MPRLGDVLGLLASLACLAVGVSTRARAAEPPTLVVYLQTRVKAHSLESLLKKEMPGVSVAVFSRYRDFEKSLEASPDAVVAMGAVTEQHDLSPQLRGLVGGETSTEYVLVSLEKPVAAAALGDKTVGVVDLLGRTGTQELVKRLLGGEPKIKLVNRVEDLLPMLRFKMADAVLILASDVSSFLAGSEMSLQVTRLPNAKTGLPVAVMITDNGKQVVANALMGLSAETRAALGIERWAR